MRKSVFIGFKFIIYFVVSEKAPQSLVFTNSLILKHLLLENKIIEALCYNIRIHFIYNII